VAIKFCSGVFPKQCLGGFQPLKAVMADSLQDCRLACQLAGHQEINPASRQERLLDILTAFMLAGLHENQHH
jgi:hypothetical protein